MMKIKILPHELLYFLYSVIYMLPVLYVYMFGFDLGGVENAIGLDYSIIEQMITFYATSLFFFYVGSFIASYRARESLRYNSDHILTSTEKLIFVVVLAATLLTKILLFKEGVYDAYAFDSGGMTSKTWTVSMGLSELAIAIFIYSLFSGNKKFAFITFIVIGSNLLHGTRIFTLISLFIYVYYYFIYLRRFSRIQLIVLAVSGGFAILITFFLVFAHRSDVPLSWDTFNIDMMISPVIYESLFNQISFVKMLGFLNHNMVPFAPFQLINDAFVFSLPVGGGVDKGSLMYTEIFGELSPLGGLSGYASAIIYFSSFYFIWYLLLGFTCSILWRFTKNINFRLLTRVAYVYFVCDTLFRFNRDPWFIALKMLFNNLFFIALVLVLMALLYRAKGKRAPQ